MIPSQGIDTGSIPVTRSDVIDLVTHFNLFKKYSNIVFCISHRVDGTMRLEDGGEKNRHKFLAENKIPIVSVVNANLVHSSNVSVVGDQDKRKTVAETDGLLTSEKELYLTITVADCLPILLHDPVTHSIALLHAGWRGLEGEIISNAIDKMVGNFGAKVEDLIAVIGPGIGSCHYEVQNDLIEKFNQYPDSIVNRDGKQYLDLKSIAKHQLTDAGVLNTHIEISSVCTYCQSDKYFSFRKDKSNPIQTMLVVAGIKS